jgi:hypothetical protein
MSEISLSVVVSEEGEIALWMELVYFQLVVIYVGVERVPMASEARDPGVADSNSSSSRCGESAGRNKGGEGLSGVDGDEENGGGDGQERGDSSISPSESSSLRSSTSQRRLAAFLVCFAGGGEIVGEFTSVGDCDGACSGSS